MEYLNLYEDFLLKNASQIISIESSLRSLTYILPGRFQDAELTSQALYAILNTIGIYHTSILRKVAILGKKEESTFNKYFHFWNSESLLNSTASKLLSIISYSQILMEMTVLKKFGKKSQYQFIIALEGIKAILKIIVFQTTNQRMVLEPHHLIRDIDPSILVLKPEKKWTGQRTGVSVPSLNNINHKKKDSSYDVTEYLLSKAITPEKLRKPSQMVQIQRNISKLGELLYIARPLVYVFSILHYGYSSWNAWYISLATEIISLLMIRKGYEYRNRGSKNNMMPLENQEYQRRLNLIMLNIMRGAFYIKITRPKLERFCNKTESKPILSIVSNVLRDYLPLWEQIYFYTSAS